MRRWKSLSCTDLVSTTMNMPWYTVLGQNMTSHPSTQKSGGLQGVISSSMFNFPAASSPKVFLPETAQLYACRVIPELDGEIVGFDITTGGIRRSGVKTGLRNVDRDFSSYSIDF